MSSHGYQKYRQKIRYLSATMALIGLLLLFTINPVVHVQSSPSDYLELIKLKHGNDPINLYETVNITLSIVNVFDEPLRNVSFTDEYNGDVVHVQNSMNSTLDYNENTTEVSWEWERLEIDESVEFWTLLNFSVSDYNISRSLAIDSTNVSFYIDYGIFISVFSNPLSVNYEYRPGIDDSGPEVKTRIKGEIDLGPVIPFAFVLVPLVLAMVAYVVFRRF